MDTFYVNTLYAMADDNNNNNEQIQLVFSDVLKPWEPYVEDEIYIAPIEKSNFTMYRNKVKKLTEEVKHLVDNIDKRGWKTFHIDHMISINYGFRNNICAYVIADISNLRLISSDENLLKGKKCYVNYSNLWIMV
jgi:hypothetical protein